jgi:hypothetical protein
MPYDRLGKVVKPATWFGLSTASRLLDVHPWLAYESIFLVAYAGGPHYPPSAYRERR